MGKASPPYARVSLRPGHARVVTLRIPRRQLQYRDDARGWVTATGRRPLLAGPDEAASPLSTTVTVRRRGAG